MKKILFVLLTFIMVGCSQDDLSTNDIGEDIQSSPDTRVLKSGGDGKYDLLGFGYDITEGYLESTSTRSQVLDIKKLIEIEGAANLNPVDSVTTTSENTYFYYGANALDYIQEINKKVVSNNSAAGGSKDSPLAALGGNLNAFTATLNIEKESNLKTTYLSRDSYAKSETIIRVKQLKINRIPTELYQYLSEGFKKHLNTYTPQQLFTEYGTHVLTNIILGGRLSSEFKSTYIEDNSYSMKRTQVKAGLNVTLGVIGLNTDNEVTKTNIETLNKKNITQNLHVRTSGGTVAIDVEYNFTDNTPPRLLTVNWKNSVFQNKGRESALVEVNWDRAYPIYEFIQDPVKREYVKQELIKYIQSKQIALQNVVPLTQWSNKKDKCCAYTCDPNYDYGYGWVKESVIAYVYEKQVSGSVPLIQWYSSYDKCYAYTCDPNYKYSSGWVCHGVIAYVPTRTTANAVPLIQWYNPVDKCRAYTCDPTYHYGYGWVREVEMGYVFPVK